MRRTTSSITAAVLAAVFLSVSAAKSGIFGDSANTQSTNAVAALAVTETPTTILAVEPIADDIEAGLVARVVDNPVVAAATETEVAPEAVAEVVTETTTTEPPLPVPVPAPTESYFDEPIIDLGQIEIPAIGLDWAMGQGVSLYNIDRGPSLWPGSALPGEMGNSVIAGHRVTKGGPFRNIDQLVNGDQVIFTVDGTRSVYEVFNTEIVTPDALYILNQTREYTATLFACHPPGSAEFRIVVQLRLIESTNAPVYADLT
ncbi:MAG: class E sortase [Acidimicrobiales bacterium]